MTLGKAERQFNILDPNPAFCESVIGKSSIYSWLHRERDQLFPDEMFADLFRSRGRHSIPPCIVATVMVLQKFEFCSDREAVDRFTFDLRWKYAAGVDGFIKGFDHTVLVNMRARLRKSKDPDRIFRVSKDVAAGAGLLGVKRVLDSTPLYDAVATQDTVTLIRSAIRGLLKVADDCLEAELRGLLQRDDDYARAGKPVCDWEDAEARTQLIDELVRDGMALLKAMEKRTMTTQVEQGVSLLATVIGQDIDQSPDGTFCIARRTAPDRVISTVDPEARHGHKSSAHGFDGFKGHIAVDPDSEVITAAEVGSANQGDGAMLPDLLSDDHPDIGQHSEPGLHGDASGDEQDLEPVSQVDAPASATDEPTQVMAVYGDSAYGSGASLAHLKQIGATPMVKVQSPHGVGGRFAKDRFDVDLEAGTVTCPSSQVVSMRPLGDGGWYAGFGKLCGTCPLREQCTTAKAGRVITISKYEALLQQARQEQADPGWKADYKANRPKVERQFGHLMRARHGGRRARVRGKVKIGQDFKHLCAARNFARLALLGVSSATGNWVGATI